MYLATLLIIVAILVFYNEINGKMNIAEYVLLAIAFVAIVRASYNYIKIDSIHEGFSSNNSKKHRKNKSDFKDIIMNSEDSRDYLDTDEIDNSNSSNIITSNIKKQSNSFDDTLNNIQDSNTRNIDAISHIDELLGINNSKSHFVNTDQNDFNDIKSVFSPQVIIGKGSNNDNGFGSAEDGSSWNSAFKNDGMKFNNSMDPSKNLWGDDHSFYDKSNTEQWTKSMDAYNKGKWNHNLYKKPSDYVDYHTSSAYGTSTPSSSSSTLQSDETSQENSSTTTDEYGQTKKLCGQYDNLFEDQAENLVVRNYKQAKQYFPGYTYVPPVHWDVPQRHISICRPNGPNVQKLTGLVDRGLPLNVLELDPNGNIADTEDTVNLTNVGCMMPKFNYQEQPFSKPYV